MRDLTVDQVLAGSTPVSHPKYEVSGVDCQVAGPKLEIRNSKFGAGFASFDFRLSIFDLFLTPGT